MVGNWRQGNQNEKIKAYVPFWHSVGVFIDANEAASEPACGMPCGIIRLFIEQLHKYNVKSPHPAFFRKR